MGLESQVSDLGTWLLGPGSRVPNPGSRAPGPGYWVPSPESWVPGPESWVPGPRSWVLILDYALIDCQHVFKRELEGKILFLQVFIKTIKNTVRLYVHSKWEVRSIEKVNTFFCKILRSTYILNQSDYFHVGNIKYHMRYLCNNEHYYIPPNLFLYTINSNVPYER